MTEAQREVRGLAATGGIAVYAVIIVGVIVAMALGALWRLTSG